MFLDVSFLLEGTRRRCCVVFIVGIVWRRIDEN